MQERGHGLVVLGVGSISWYDFLCMYHAKQHMSKRDHGCIEMPYPTCYKTYNIYNYDSLYLIVNV